MSYDPIFEISKTLNLNPFIMINLHSMVEYSALPDRSPFSFFSRWKFRHLQDIVEYQIASLRGEMTR